MTDERLAAILDLVEAGEALMPDPAAALVGYVRRLQKQRRAALDMAFEYGGIDGAHHKHWTIDQMVRALAGDGYDAWVAAYREGEDGPDTYEWESGGAP